MKLTDTQLRWLRWLHDNGGSGFLDNRRLIANGARAGYSSEICFLYLVIRGAIEAKNERLVITDYGLRCLGILK
jgi:hypothetical protein